MGQTTLLSSEKPHDNDTSKELVEGIKKFIGEEDERKSGKAGIQIQELRGGILYLVFDPSLVISLRRLRAGINLFRAIRKAHSLTRVVLPDAVHQILLNLREGRRMSRESQEVILAWRPSTDEAYFSELQDNASLAAEFLEVCEPAAASSLIGDVDRIGERTVTRQTLASFVGGVLGSLLFEMLAMAHKFKARLLTFGDRLGTLLHRARFLVVSIHHGMKEELKRRSHTRTALKIAVWVFSSLTANYVMDLIPGMPAGDLGVILRGLAWAAAALAADQLEDVIERGLIVIINGSVYYPAQENGGLSAKRS